MKGKKTGGGSRKGIPNRVTKALKDMILSALDKAGGEKYLVQQAQENPNAFLTLVGKVLPMQVTGPNDGPIRVDGFSLVPLGALTQTKKDSDDD